ncbi:MAG: ABC transporter substrate-binding protein [Rhodobiaceae bacterium]|nr:ABC transporter substrate-binding protein [Rhodobiaceae bacterium]
MGGNDMNKKWNAIRPSRRAVLAGIGASVAAPAILRHSRAYAANPVIKVGHVSPRTGPLAGFAEADDYVLSGVADIFKAGLANNGKTYTVEVISKDSQSNPNRAAEVAADLILGEKVDIIVAAATPDTTNPVADQAEVNEVPCITTNCPWQPYFFGRRGDPAKGFDYTYHFFWGLEDVIAAFLDLWDGSGVGKTVAGIFPNDADGNAWGDKELGLPKPLAAAGYNLVDPGRYQPLTDDFSSQIAAYKAAGCEIVTGNMIPPDFATFWAQCAQQGFKPKVVTIGKALLFPSVIESLGDRGDGLTSEIWWTPGHPFSSSLTKASARQLADGYTAATGRPWTQPIGFQHALFEVTADVIRRAGDLGDKAAILEAIRTTDLATIVGPVNWAKGPVKNVTKTPLVAGQWQKGEKGFELVVTANAHAPEIPKTGELKLLG